LLDKVISIIFKGITSIIEEIITGIL